jgi:hypothetical protein
MELETAMYFAVFHVSISILPRTHYTCFHFLYFFTQLVKAWTFFIEVDHIFRAKREFYPHSSCMMDVEFQQPTYLHKFIMTFPQAVVPKHFSGVTIEIQKLFRAPSTSLHKEIDSKVLTQWEGWVCMLETRWFILGWIVDTATLNQLSSWRRLRHFNLTAVIAEKHFFTQVCCAESY